jgi:hypothetical protein
MKWCKNKTVEDAPGQTRMTHCSSPPTANYYLTPTDYLSYLMPDVATMVVDKVHVSHAKAPATSK